MYRFALYLAALGVAIAAGTGLFAFAAVSIPTGFGLGLGIILGTIGFACVIGLAAVTLDGPAR